ncbi:hypothetical protein E5163_14805 [Marinicauda algicola]|uniref:Uncharacterized protein n=1 Tax=Marinicauda algicola TaxID=2029849 RepID=A0A4S2GW85_9PROT|nr:hypothetical protein [Marinicauda algicola]TGY87335.1 hypothetical protein E5163_14805 [Marinicauda algicola]
MPRNITPEVVLDLDRWLVAVDPDAPFVVLVMETHAGQMAVRMREDQVAHLCERLQAHADLVRSRNRRQ